MGMENGGKATDEIRPTYWLDACEDDDIIPCDLIGGFGDSVHQDCVGDDQAFFGGIDHILDCIKNGNGLPSSPQPISIHGDGMEISTSFENGEDGEIRVFELEDEKLAASYTTENLNSEELRGSHQQDNGGIASNGHFKQINRNSDVNDEKRKLGPVDSRIKIENCSPEFSRDREVPTEERYGKRARVRGGYEDDRFVSSRGRDYVRERDGSGRKRYRDWEEPVRKDREHFRRREYGSRNREGRERDQRGYWERDRLGSKDIVFRLGAYEADRTATADGKKGEFVKVLESNGVVEKENNGVGKKEKVPEEKARQYQLDVLEQAKQKNTIAFLETGAGKTLIAVLLIKSICSKLKEQNRKMLSVFLVPKVPLVYQRSSVNKLVTVWAIIVVKWVKISGTLEGGNVSLKLNRFL